MRKWKNHEKDIVIAIEASNKNYEWCCKAEGNKYRFGYKIKYIIWYLILIFLSPKKKFISKTFVCACTPVNRKRLMSFTEKEELYYFGKLNARISQIKCNRSVLSPYSIKNRITIASRSIIFYLRNRDNLKGYFHFVLEYYAIANFIFDNLPTTIISPGMYDRYSTLFSYLGHVANIKLIGVQDGAAIDIDVPVKVYCDKMYAFDKYEGEIIKNFILNKTCKFSWIGFISTLEWDEIQTNNKIIIAVASQDWFTSEYIELIDSLMSSIDRKKYQVVVYPHYRERYEQYQVLCTKYPELLIETNIRHKNIDLLITFYSTIVYDFWSVQEKLNVFCLRIPGFNPGYYNRQNVTVFDSKTELISSIMRINKNEYNKH